MSGAMVLRSVKLLVFAACIAVVLPLIALAWLEKRFSRSSLVFVGLAQALALVPSILGAYLRAAYYFGTLDECAWETHVGFGSLFVHRGASLGRHASMGHYCVIGHARIGERVMMGSRVSIPSGKRQHFGEDGELVRDARFDTVSVGADTWVGEGAILVADVGARCVISAGAVVVKPIPDDAIAGGNPAKVLRSRAPIDAVADDSTGVA